MKNKSSTQLSAKDITEKFNDIYARAIEYEKTMSTYLHTSSTEIANELVDVAQNLETNKIGYIVATCSPTTKAHIELAKQAIKDIDLDTLFFIIWPFHYIPGFHAKPLTNWVAEQKHVDWDERINILTQALTEESSDKLKILFQSKQWYEESERFFNQNESRSYFWTGTWYVIRKLQKQLSNFISEPLNFYFVCGADQFNPNIKSLKADSAREKVWLDYCIAQHLAINHVYVVPRQASEDDVELFEPPETAKHRIIIGSALENHEVSATQVRFKQDSVGAVLESYCPHSVAKYIKHKGLWGYQ